MPPIPGPRSYTEEDLRYDQEWIKREFDRAALPTNTEVVQICIGAILAIATIILLPLLCGTVFYIG